eukprot:scaffold151768_cov52-Cyclotella_meneghiniana.AAC.1
MSNSLHLRFTFSSFDTQLTKTMNVEGSQSAAFRFCCLSLVGSCRDSGSRQLAECRGFWA